VDQGGSVKKMLSDESIKVAPEPKHCEQCRHFGHWLPVQVGDRIDYGIHCWCKLHKSVTADPANGCEFWLEREKTIPASSGL